MAETKKKLGPEPGSNLNRGQGEGGGPKSKGQVKFVDDTAKATGRSKTSVKKDKARGEKIAPDVQKEITRTKIADSGVQLGIKSYPQNLQISPNPIGQTKARSISLLTQPAKKTGKSKSTARRSQSGRIDPTR